MRAYVDGSSKGLYGYELRQKGKEKKVKIVEDYPMTNNQAEWLAFLTLLMDLAPGTKIEIYSDSQIVVHQFLGDWETKAETLRHLKEVCRLVAEVKRLQIKLRWVSRKDNPYGKILEKRIQRERKFRKKLRDKIARGY